MNPRVLAVMRKEFREYRRNKFVIFTMAILPVIFLAIPVITVLALPANVPEAARKVAVGQSLLMFFLIPMILPTTVAAYAVIGEREQGTLEPVLTTPILDRELLLGKALAATVPAVALGWVMFAIFAVVVRLFAAQGVIDRVFRVEVFVADITLGPVFAVFAIWVALAISVRSTDVRVAQQLAGLTILPVIGLSALLSFGVIAPTLTAYLALAALVAAVDVLGWRIATRMFDRERLLTRYSRSD